MGRNPVALFKRHTINPDSKRKRKTQVAENATAAKAAKHIENTAEEVGNEWQFQDNEDGEDAWQEVKDSGVSAALTNPGKSQYEVEGEAKKGSLLRSAKELYKAPTRQELEELKATNDLFKSNLFKLQMSEMVKEVSVTRSSNDLLKTVITKIKSSLEGLKEKTLKIAEGSKLKHGVHFPGISAQPIDEVVLEFKAPKVQVVGSYMVGTVARPHCNVDVTVTIPKSCFQVKDYASFRYFQKRSAYLSHIADALVKVKSLTKLKFSTVIGGGNLPILVATPIDIQGDKKSKFVIRIHPVITPDTFANIQRLAPNRNNVRVAKSKSILDKCSCTVKEGGPIAKDQFATPHYNNQILADMLHYQHLQFIAEGLRADQEGTSPLQEAVLLLKTWLSQRKMGASYPGTLTGFAITMIMLHVKKSKKLSRNISAYQMFKATIAFLAESDLSTEGIKMEFQQYDGMPVDCPSLEEFNKAFHVVLVDPSHCVNLLGNISRGSYKNLRHEAQLAVRLLDHPDDKFSALFLQPIKHEDKFDMCIEIMVRPSTCSKYPGQLLDWGGDWKGFSAVLLQTLLTKGLTDRVHLIAPIDPPAMEWGTTESPDWQHSNKKSTHTIRLGLLLDPQNAYRELDIGASAEETAKAAAFRDFWGDKSELRRFQDGSINEAVVWEYPANRKHVILRDLIRHVLKRHVNILEKDIKLSMCPYESVLSSSDVIEDTGVTTANAVSEAFHELAGKIRRLDGMPLMITAVQCVAPSVRYCEVFPPTPNGHKTDDGTLPWMQALPCYLTVEQSGKWPDNYEAIQHVKTAMFIRMAKLLETNHGIRCSVSATHADVSYAGYAFRIQLFVDREVALTKRSAENLATAVQTLKSAGTPKPEITQAHRLMAERYLLLQEHMTFRPYHHASILAISLAHGAFSGGVRLAKRWVASHFFAEDLSDPVVELLVAYLFVNPAPFTAPGTPEVTFLRFLSLLSTHSWLDTPLIIDLLGDMSPASYASISAHFRENRKSLPTMFLATAKDTEMSLWTRAAPSKSCLVRIVQYATQSLQTARDWAACSFQPNNVKDGGDTEAAIGEMVSALFRTPLQMYQILIHLDPHNVPRRFQDLDYVAPSQKKRKYKNLEEDDEDKAVMKVDFNPPLLLLEQLRAQFGDSVLFFYNPLGGAVIAGVINPQVLQPFPFKVPYAANSRPATFKDPKETKAVFNIPAALETIRTLGRGLVVSVDSSYA